MVAITVKDDRIEGNECSAPVQVVEPALLTLRINKRPNLEELAELEKQDIFNAYVEQKLPYPLPAKVDSLHANPRFASCSDTDGSLSAGGRHHQ